MSWNIVLYEAGKQKPVEQFIDGLQAATQAKLVRQLDLLTEFGPQLGMPHAKPIGKGLYELRVRGKQEVRVLYIYVSGDTIYLLHAFLKKTHAIPSKELSIAVTRKTEIEKL